MGEETAISWCDHTFNPWDGCTHAPNPDGTTAPECDNCYAEATDRRFSAGAHWGPNTDRKTHSVAYWRKPLLWNAKALKAGKRARVFCASQSDVFERHPNPTIDTMLVHLRSMLFAMIMNTPQLDWLLLTKRPDSAATMLPWSNDGEHYAHIELSKRAGHLVTLADPWPNIWLGTSCGHPSSMWRVETLRMIPAAVRFISCEPLLADFTAAQWDTMLGGESTFEGARLSSFTYPIDWLIVGDESGRARRPAQADWVRSAREAAQRHGVAFHFKQWNSPQNASIRAAEQTGSTKIHLPILDGRQWKEFPR